MKKFWQWSWIWVVLCACTVILGIWIWKLLTADYGSDLYATLHYTKDRVITEDVSTYEKDGITYVKYLDMEYLLPPSDTIPLGEVFSDYGKRLHEKVVKSIIYDKTEHEYLYREDISVHSSEIQKKKTLMRIASKFSFLLGCVLFVPAFICLLFTLISFTTWADDVEDAFRERKKRKKSDWYRLLVNNGQHFCYFSLAFIPFLCIILFSFAWDSR